MTPHASLACVQSRVPAWEDFSWTEGPEKEDSLSTTCQGNLPAGDVPPTTLPLQNGALWAFGCGQGTAEAWRHLLATTLGFQP